MVASIHRAVDDKVAQNLLGERFKQQIRLDGNLGKLTLVCSKSDDIMPEHAWIQFSLEKEHSSWKKAEKSLDHWKSNKGETLDNLHTKAEALAELTDEVSIRLDK